MVRLAFLLLALIAPASASAATVSSTTTSFYDPGGKGFPELHVVTLHVTVEAAPGEGNVVDVRAGAGAMVVRDAGAPLAPGAGCAAAADGAVTCAAPGAQELALIARLGDGDDRLEVGAGVRATVDAGPGNDAEGASGGGELDGGDGDDAIVARNGADLAHGGPGSDEISDVGDDGGAGDVFHGDEGDDALFGARLLGGPGKDELYGDVMDGGPGDDTLGGPRSKAEARRLACGPGRDTVALPADPVLLPAGCERVEPWLFGDVTLRVPPRVAGRRVTVAMPNPCVYLYVRARCRVKAALFVRGRHVGTLRVRWRRERDGGRLLRFVAPRRVRRGDVLWLRLVKYETDVSTERGGYSVRLR